MEIFALHNIAPVLQASSYSRGIARNMKTSKLPQRPAAIARSKQSWQGSLRLHPLPPLWRRQAIGVGGGGGSQGTDFPSDPGADAPSSCESKPKSLGLALSADALAGERKREEKGLEGVLPMARAMHASQGSAMFQVLFPTYRGHASGEEYWEKPPLASA